MRTRYGRLHIYKDRRKEWRWRLVAPNGRIIADSGEGYSRKRLAHLGWSKLCEYAQRGVYCLTH